LPGHRRLERKKKRDSWKEAGTGIKLGLTKQIVMNMEEDRF
jgi:hypothetical protein